MSLLKRLLASVTLVMVCVLVATVWVSANSTRAYLNEQLKTHSDVAIQALERVVALDSSSEVSGHLRSLMTSLFETGQFSRMTLGQPGQAPELSLQADAAQTLHSAPGWFKTLLNLEAPEVVRTLRVGSSTMELTIVANGATAYLSLYQGTLRVLFWVLAAGLAWAAFAAFLVRWLKRAFAEEITSQVETIVDGHSSMPVNYRVRELADVGLAVREAREQVRATSQEQTDKIESLQLELNRDAVTGLASRRYILNELRASLAPHLDSSQREGHVMIFRQRDLAELNRYLPRTEVDQWLRSVLDAVKAAIETTAEEDVQLGRLNGSDFICLMPAAQGGQATRLAQAICRVLNARRADTVSQQPCRWAVALTNYLPDDNVTSVLSRLDQALMRAENAGHGHVEYSLHGSGRTDRLNADGASNWYKRIHRALDQNTFFLRVVQVDYEGEPEGIRFEAGLCIPAAIPHEEPLTGYLFMPPAARLGLSGVCDIRAIELALAWLDQHPKADLVIKVSLASLLEEHFAERVASTLAGHSQLRRLILELDAHALSSLTNEVQELSRHVTPLGVRIGLRRFAEDPHALLFIHRIPLAYIKLSGDLVVNMLSSPGGQQLMVAMTEVSIGMGIKVFAEDVPDAGVQQLLQEYGAQPVLA